jgi:glycosyltransferase involved in cell wall biosynthesis
MTSPRALIFSVVVPVYQNEANLSSAIPALLSLRERIGDRTLELVLVDDGSSDGSYEILRDFAKRYPETIRVVRLSRNFGQTPAIQAGLKFARGDCVGIISADLQEPHEVFVDMLREWERGAKFVIGERRAREEPRAHQRVSGIYWTLIRKLAFADFPPLGYDFCLLDRQLVADINQINEKNSSIFVLLYWLGYRPVRIPITRKVRDGGTSQWRSWRKISFTLDTLIGFTYFPARLITVLGIVTAFACLAYLAFLLTVWALYQSAPPGWMTVTGLLTLLGAMLLFSLGIVSEYLVRILDEARKRPPYVVDTLLGDDDKPTKPS